MEGAGGSQRPLFRVCGSGSSRQGAPSTLGQQTIMATHELKEGKKVLTADTFLLQQYCQLLPNIT